MTNAEQWARCADKTATCVSPPAIDYGSEEDGTVPRCTPAYDAFAGVWWSLCRISGQPTASSVFPGVPS